MDMKRNAQAKAGLFIGMVFVVIGYIAKFNINNSDPKGDVLFFIFNLIGIVLIFVSFHYNHGSIYFQHAKSDKYINQNPSINVPKCPTCGSTNVEKISGVSKAGKAVAFGVLAAGSISKTFHCKNCGYRW